MRPYFIFLLARGLSSLILALFGPGFPSAPPFMEWVYFVLFFLEQALTRLWLRKHVQVNGSYAAVTVPVAAVFSLVIFRYVNNIEYRLYFTSAYFLLFYFKLCTTFQGRSVIAPNQLCWTIDIYIGQACQINSRKSPCKNLWIRDNGWTFWYWTWEKKKIPDDYKPLLWSRYYFNSQTYIILYFSRLSFA